MYFDTRPDRVGWTIFEVTTGEVVTLRGVPLTCVDLDAADELVVLLHRERRLQAREPLSSSSRAV